MIVPDFFVVGAPKCGTTALHAFLAEHPDVFMPDLKELHHFGIDLAGLASYLDGDQHTALFADARPEQRIGESCIWALFSKTAAREIHEARPDARIVIMLREPVDMMYALHSEYVWGGTEDVSSFERALALESVRKQNRRLTPNGEPPQLLFYREVVSYSRQVQRYYDAFGRDQVHVILFDDFKRDLPGEYRKLLSFLDVDPGFQPEFRIINPNRRIRSIRLRRIMLDPDHPVRRIARRLVPVSRIRHPMEGLLTAFNSVNAPRRSMKSAQRERLRAEMVQEVEALSRILDRDLGHWLSRAAE